jgi:hypothetical protein
VYLPFLLLAKKNIMFNNSENVWGIKEFEEAGESCPIIPVNLPWYKKAVLTFFRFGVCPACITLSLCYSITKKFKKLVGVKN